ncbi:glycosyltransferase family 4 protein [Frigoribacterium sp. CFBP 13605]|uniref:glycosyltransferase family 4 protein n=1 Tax=Frigoribacterium sp. CFBP 13605 TaxID=2774034 RepID=UPI0019034C5C|nr:glycosyltransferase family 4 protein [Frigoribacterium sp. CFBP 13605]MBD8140017.1 glycosyltransferase family 4 protein [Frigoribacterium sp. CFBP 13605]
MTSSTASPPLRVLIVSQYFRPERVSIPITLADELSRRGHDVEVLTGWPNYPDGELFPTYKQRLRHTERQGGVMVHRVPLIISHSRSAVGRLLNYASFAFSSTFRFGLARRADVVYVYATQMTASIGPLLWNRAFGTPYVLHVQDLWPESIVDSGMVDRRVTAIIRRILTPWLTTTYGRAAHVVGIAPTMLSMLRSRGARSTDSSVVYNWAPADVVETDDSFGSEREGATANSTTFVYAGNLGEMQDLLGLIDAFALCADVPDIELVIAGSGVMEADLRQRAAQHPGARITFTSRLDAGDMRALNARSDFQFVTLKGLDIFRGTIPSKLQNSLATGVPVITTVHGDVTELVEREGLGLSASPNDPGSLAGAIRRAAAMTQAERATLAARARRFYEEYMSEAAGISSIEAILQASRRTTQQTDPAHVMKEENQE